MQLDDFICSMNEQATKFLENADYVEPEKIGLERRCGMVWVGEDFIATKNNKSLRYYGGFEYCDQTYVTQVGEYVFYSSEDERVNEHLEHYHTVAE
jgi:hypothetical protein